MRPTDPVSDGGVSAHSLERAGGQQCGSGGVGARARGASGSDRLRHGSHPRRVTILR